jgi:hypothetical protein
VLWIDINCHVLIILEYSSYICLTFLRICLSFVEIYKTIMWKSQTVRVDGWRSIKNLKYFAITLYCPWCTFVSLPWLRFMYHIRNTCKQALFSVCVWKILNPDSLTSFLTWRHLPFSQFLQGCNGNNFFQSKTLGTIHFEIWKLLCQPEGYHGSIFF